MMFFVSTSYLAVRAVELLSFRVSSGHAKEGRLRYFYALLVLLLAFSSSSSTPPRCDTVTRLRAIKALRS